MTRRLSVSSIMGFFGFSDEAKEKTEQKGSFEGSKYRYITLKARVENVEAIEEAIFSYTEQIGQITHEEDYYFDVPQGQLKLRYTRPNQHHAELIAYEQTNVFGPNICEFRSCRVTDPDLFHKTLSMTLPELGVIKRRRRTYAKNSEHVVINVDDVEHLGQFVDIIIAADGSNDSKPMELITRLQKEFGISDENLVAFSYLDMLRKHKSFDKGIEDDLSSLSTSDASL